MKHFSKNALQALPLIAITVVASTSSAGCARINPEFGQSESDTEDSSSDGDDSRGDSTTGSMDETGSDSDPSESGPGQTNTTEPPTTGDTDDSVDTTVGDSSTGEPCVGITLSELAEDLGAEECDDLFSPLLCDADLPMDRSLFAFALHDATYPYQWAGFEWDYTTNYGEPPEPRFVDVPPSLASILEPMNWSGVLGSYGGDDDTFGPNAPACSEWAQPIIDQTLALPELYCVFSNQYEDYDVGLNSGFFNLLDLTCFGTRVVFDEQGQIVEDESLLLGDYGPIEVYNDYQLDGIPDAVTDPGILDGIRLNCINGDGTPDETKLFVSGATSFQPNCYSPAGVDDEEGLNIRVQGSTAQTGIFGTEVRVDIRTPKGFVVREWNPPGVNRTTVTVVEAPK